MMENSGACGSLTESAAGAVDAGGDAAADSAAADGATVTERRPPSAAAPLEKIDVNAGREVPETPTPQQKSAGDVDARVRFLPPPVPFDGEKREAPNQPPQVPLQGVAGGPLVLVRGSRPLSQPPSYMAGGPGGPGGGGGGWGGGGGGGGWGGGRAWGDDDNAAWPVAEWFAAPGVRRAFVRKVYAILALQLVATVGVIALFVFVPSVKLFALQHLEVYVVAIVLFFTTYLVLLCCGNVRRRYPCNLLLLGVFTLSFAYLLGIVSAFHSTYIVFLAVAITAAVCLLVTLIATFSEVDITGCSALLCVISVGVVIFGLAVVLVSVFWGYNRILIAVYAGLIAIVFSLYLMYDTQMLMGGRKLALSPDEHIFAALTLYVDVANMFWAILTLLGACCSE